LDKLSSAIKKNLNKTWAQSYQKDFGKLNDFIKKNDFFFHFDDKSKLIYLKDVRYQSVNHETFQREYTAIVPTQSIALVPENQQVDEDEKLAMMIQQEENQLSGSEAIDSPTESWQSRSKKSRKQRNKETAKALAKTMAAKNSVKFGDEIHEDKELSNSLLKNSLQNVTQLSTSEQSTQPPQSEIPPIDDSDENLAQLLLNEFHGRFYCFNDSNVRPIYVTDLCKAFEGEDSAYILIYRKIDMGNLSVFHQYTRTSDLTQSSESSTKYSNLIFLRNLFRSKEDGSPIINPPTFWKTKVDEVNSSLTTKRSEYNITMKSLQFRVFFPEHFYSDWPCLYLKHERNANEKMNVPQIWYEGMNIEIDMNQTVEELSRHIWSEMIREAQKTNNVSRLGELISLPTTHQTRSHPIDFDVEALVQYFQLSEMLHCSKLSTESSALRRYYLKKSPEKNLLIKDIFTHHSSIVFYSSQSPNLPNKEPFEFLESPPKELILTYQSEDDIHPTFNSISLFVPYHYTVQTLCQYICSYLNFPSVQFIQMYLIQTKQVTPATTNTRTTQNSMSTSVGISLNSTSVCTSVCFIFFLSFILCSDVTESRILS
jgi:hypothetical protein